MLQPSPNEKNGQPLDIDELEDAISDIGRGMGKRFNDGSFSIHQAVAMLQRLRPMPETQLATELHVLKIPRECYDRLCALKHDLLHHTQVDIDEVPEARPRKKTEKEKKLHEEAAIHHAPAIGGGLEMTAQEAMRTITKDIGNMGKRIQALIDATPKDALPAVPSVVRALEAASAAHYAEIEKTYGLAKEGLLAAKRSLDAGNDGLSAPAKKAVASLEKFYAAQYQRIMKEHGLERPLVIQWTIALKEDPTALIREAARKEEEKHIEADEQDYRLARDVPMFPMIGRRTASDPQASAPATRAGRRNKKKLS